MYVSNDDDLKLVAQDDGIVLYEYNNNADKKKKTKDDTEEVRYNKVEKKIYT